MDCFQPHTQRQEISQNNLALVIFPARDVRSHCEFWQKSVPNRHIAIDNNSPVVHCTQFVFTMVAQLWLFETVSKIRDMCAGKCMPRRPWQG